MGRGVYNHVFRDGERIGVILIHDRMTPDDARDLAQKIYMAIGDAPTPPPQEPEMSHYEQVAYQVKLIMDRGFTFEQAMIILCNLDKMQ